MFPLGLFAFGFGFGDPRSGHSRGCAGVEGGPVAREFRIALGHGGSEWLGVSTPMRACRRPCVRAAADVEQMRRRFDSLRRRTGFAARVVCSECGSVVGIGNPAEVRRRRHGQSA